MKIDIEHYDKKFSAELSNESTIVEVLEAIHGLLVACTYPSDLVKQYVKTEDE